MCFPLCAALHFCARGGLSSTFGHAVIRSSSSDPDTLEAPAEGSSGFDDAVARLGVKISTRRGLPLVMSVGQNDVVYVVLSGVLNLTSELSDDRHVIACTFYAGDVISARSIAGLPNERLLVAQNGEVVRLRKSVFNELLAGSPAHAQAYEQRMQRRVIRDEVHNVVVGSLTGDEKIASYLIEAGQMLGTTINNSVDIPLPLSRGEIANYLALNPDTLSRLLRRLDVTHIVTFVGRHRAIVDNWQALLARSPIAETLLRAYTR